MRIPIHASRSAVLVSLGFAVGGLLLAAIPASAAQGASTADARAQLASATASREQADNRLAELQIERTDLQAKLSAGSKRTEALAAEVAAARQAARQSAIDAYVSGGNASELTAVLTSGGPSDASAKTTYIANQAQTAINDAEHYRNLRDRSGRSAADLAAQIDTLNQRITDATSDAEQAAAIEADAERAVEQADAAAQSAARAAAAPHTTTTQRPTVKSAPAPTPRHTTRRATTATTTTSTTTTLVLGSSVPSDGTTTTTTTTPPPSGTTPAMWAALRQCESGGNYSAVSLSGRYRGAYQFDQQTWESVGGTGDPAAAAPAEQDYRAQLLYQRRGPRAWPVCGSVLPLN